MTERESDVIAIFNTSEDTVGMLRYAFEAQGFTVVTAFTHDIRDGHVSLTDLLTQHRPSAIVYDIALPYEQNWRLFRNIEAAPVSRGIPFVLTTTNVKQVRAVAGPEPELLEIVGKPYDLGVLIERVTNAIKANAASSNAE